MKQDEQWLLDGNCDECRRKEYCGKPCKIKRVKSDGEFRKLIADATGISKIFNLYENVLGKGEG